MSALKYWLWLSTAAKLPPKSKAELLEYYGSPEMIYMAPPGELSRLLCDIPGSEELEKRDLGAALRIIDRCQDQSIDIVTVQDARYPERLRNVFAPPQILYVKGKLPPVDDEAVIALIGTRRASPYGLRMAYRLGYEIASSGGIVVSGVTSGCEEAGVRGALEAEGKCIGVIAVPHELCRGRLEAELAVRGALISEYPPGTKPISAFFRARNRITSGLSVGVAVVEAPERSGTRLFVADAADQGKEIFVVPGNADSENCAGTNTMLKEGAKAVTCGWDILCEFEQRFPGRLSRSAEKPVTEEEKPAEPEPAVSPEPKKTTKKVIDKPEKAEYIDSVKQEISLSDTQWSIVSALSSEPTHIDEVIGISGLAPARVLAELTLLQLRGIVRQEPGKRFTLIKEIK